MNPQSSPRPALPKPSTLSNLEDAELLDLLSRGEMDIYIGVLVAVCHLEPVG